jgi:hypothetical protein
MPLDKSQIRKGAFMTGANCEGSFVARRARSDDEALLRAYPEFADTIKAAGPSHGPAFEREMASIKEMARRLENVREQLKKVRGK